MAIQTPAVLHVVIGSVAWACSHPVCPVCVPLLSGLGLLAALPQEVLHLILTEAAGAHSAARSVSHGFKELFDGTKTTLVVGDPQRIYPSDIGQLITNVIQNSKRVVSVTVNGLNGPQTTLSHIASSLVALKDLRTLVIPIVTMGELWSE